MTPRLPQRTAWRDRGPQCGEGHPEQRGGGVPEPGDSAQEPAGQSGGREVTHMRTPRRRASGRLGWGLTAGLGLAGGRGTPALGLQALAPHKGGSG